MHQIINCSLKGMLSEENAISVNEKQFLSFETN